VWLWSEVIYQWNIDCMIHRWAALWVRHCPHPLEISYGRLKIRQNNVIIFLVNSHIVIKWHEMYSYHVVKLSNSVVRGTKWRWNLFRITITKPFFQWITFNALVHFRILRKKRGNEHSRFRLLLPLNDLEINPYASICP
jgi:hypothetical protein